MKDTRYLNLKKPSNNLKKVRGFLVFMKKVSYLCFVGLRKLTQF
jgi:hypothetical protein